MQGEGSEGWRQRVMEVDVEGSTVARAENLGHSIQQAHHVSRG